MHRRRCSDPRRGVFVYLFNGGWLDTTNPRPTISIIHVSHAAGRLPYACTPLRVLLSRVYTRVQRCIHMGSAETGQTRSQLPAQIFVPGQIAGRYLQHALAPTTTMMAWGTGVRSTRERKRKLRRRTQSAQVDSPWPGQRILLMKDSLSRPGTPRRAWRQ